MYYRAITIFLKRVRPINIYTCSEEIWLYLQALQPGFNLHTLFPTTRVA